MSNDVFWELYHAATRVDAANAKRAEAAIQDRTVRLDYEETMGAALDNLRLVLDKINQIRVPRTSP